MSSSRKPSKCFVSRVSRPSLDVSKTHRARCVFYYCAGEAPHVRYIQTTSNNLGFCLKKNSHQQLIIIQVIISVFRERCDLKLSVFLPRVDQISLSPFVGCISKMGVLSLSLLKTFLRPKCPASVEFTTEGCSSFPLAGGQARRRRPT